jgi:secreted Zn-dependent insulinase-like peptidase
MSPTGHEGAGSLRSALVQRGWALSVSAYPSTDVSDCHTFEVSVDLTELGEAHRYEVVEVVLAYVDLLRQSYIGWEGNSSGISTGRDGTQDATKAVGLPSYLLDELQTMSSVSFNYSEKSDPATYVSTLASVMQSVPAPRDYLTAQSLFEYPDQARVAAYLSHLTPEDARITCVSPDFKDKTTQIGRYYGTEYRTVALGDGTAEEQAVWRRLQRVTAQDYPELALPKQNELIPASFDLVSSNAAAAVSVSGAAAAVKNDSDNQGAQAALLTTLMAPPALVRHDACWQVWHKPDVSFRLPKVYALIDLAAPADVVSAKFVVQSRLFSSCFAESMSEFFYTAKLAGVSMDLDLTNRGATLVLSGYSDKLRLFALRALTSLRTFRPNEATFERYREQLLRDLNNFSTQQPYYHASYYASLALESNRYPIPDLLEAAKSIRIEDIHDFLASHYGRSYGKALMMGNIDAKGAEGLVDAVQEVFPFTALSAEQRAKVEVTMIPRAAELSTSGAISSQGSAEAKPTGVLIAHPEPNPKDTNSAVSFYFQLPRREPTQYMHVELLAEVLEQLFYNSLRTQQQLGYVVSASLQKREGIRLINFVVQSSIADGAELRRRVEAFIRDEVPVFVDSLTEESLEVYKQGIAVRKLEPDQRLTSQASRFWGEIVSRSVAEAPVGAGCVSVTTAGGDREAGEVAAPVCVTDNSAVSSVPVPRFDRRVQEVSALQTITLQDFRQFAHIFLSASSPDRRVLVSQITSQIPVGAAGEETCDASDAEESSDAAPIARICEANANAVVEAVEVACVDISGREVEYQRQNQHM